MKVGLLLVHGIGAQAPGETTQKFIEGFSRAAKVSVRSDTLPITLQIGDRTLVLFEVYWADLLSGDRVKGTANIFYLLPLAWFPWFNRSFAAFQAAYSNTRALCWCIILSLAGVGFWLAWELLAFVVVIWFQAAPVMGLLALVSEGFLWKLKAKLPLIFPPTSTRSEKYANFRERAQEAWQRYDAWLEKRHERGSAPPPLPGATDELLVNARPAVLNKRSTAIFQKAIRSFRTTADDLFDEYVGDIQNYINSAAGAFPDRHELSRVSDEIRRRFYTQLRRACESDCDEIQILAHSLGTVIAYHGLTGFGLPELGLEADQSTVITPLARISHIFTIGSPLEKIRFVWPKLIFDTERYQLCWKKTEHTKFYRTPATAAVTAGLRWDNFWNSLDLISGHLKHFDCWCPIGNHPVRGGAGVLRAHVVYERTSDFLSFATRSLIGECRDPIAVGLMDKLFAWGENVAVPFILAVSIVGGTVFYYYIALAIAWLITFPFGNPEPAQNAIKWFLILGLAAGVLWLPRRNAAVEHEAHWLLAGE